MGMDFPKNVFEQIQQQLASQGRIGATRVFQTQPVASPNPGEISAPAPIYFPQRGIALAMYGMDQQATADAYAKTSVRCQIGGTEDLFVDGLGSPTFIPLLPLFGGVANWFPLLRRVQSGIPWVFTFRNEGGDGNIIIPSIQITVITDIDVANMLTGQQ